MGLTTLFGNIADAIREKDGSAEAITANDFPDRIRAIRTSPKYLVGRDWHGVAALPYDHFWTDSICYGNGRFVAIPQEQGKNYGITSTDGIHWEEIMLPALTDKSHGCRGICFLDGMFFYVESSSSRLMYSKDALTWHEKKLPASLGWTSIARGGGVMVVVAPLAKSVAFSRDLINWSQPSIPDPTPSGATTGGVWGGGFTYGGGKFVLLSTDSDAAIYSEDGLTWTKTCLPKSGYWENLVYGKGKFVTAYQKTIICSSDGVDWEIAAELPSTAYVDTLAYGGGVFIAVTSNYAYDAYYSKDAVNWMRANNAPKNFMSEATYGNGVFVAAPKTPKNLYYSFTGDDPATAT